MHAPHPHFPRYELLFGEGEFNGTLLIGPDPLGGNFDYQVFLEARRKFKLIDFRMTGSERGLEVYEKIFDFNNKSIKAHIQLVHGRNYHGDVQELWHEALANDDLIYLKTHAGYGRHISLSDDVRYFTEFLKKVSDAAKNRTDCSILIAARVRCIMRMYCAVTQVMIRILF